MHNKVIWSEGLFLQPQHLQQQDRYLESYVEVRCRDLSPHSWGFTELEIERDLLAIGKLALRRAAGVFPDGTPFRIPDDEPLPAALDIGPQVRDQIVSLAVPLRRGDSPGVERTGAADPLARYSVREWEVRDVAAQSGEPAVVEVGALRTRFLLQSDLAEAYSTIPLAQIVECRADKQIVLEDRFMPTVLRTNAATALAAFLNELVGLLRHRGEALGGRVTATDRAGSAQFGDFMMLQLINRTEPVFAHHAESAGLHPQTLFRDCLALAGELSTYTAPSKRPPAMPNYQHERLRQSFEPLMRILREALSLVIESSALNIPIEPRAYGISVAIVPDASLYTKASFILAAKADVPSEQLRRAFATQLKLGPVERIRDIVMLQLPGVPVNSVPVAPRQIPYHAGFVYFEIDQSHELWAQLKSSGGLALFVAGEFPGLSIELWAIRS
ncbi:MAG: type VI secretion system baseplate subunit TssK [Vicinamibacterales bacterium]